MTKHIWYNESIYSEEHGYITYQGDYNGSIGTFIDEDGNDHSYTPFEVAHIMGKPNDKVILEVYVANSDDELVYYAAAVELMDNGIREEIHATGTYDGDAQGFFDEYCKRHREKYGEEFVV